ncbi:MAG: branched-chain amino acid transport system substrate-binding protein [Solirubrobacterales bacterium]|nr:branched-chain amino acid transport system substrate-binding protein [Solirubrobacterales bacterium]
MPKRSWASSAALAAVAVLAAGGCAGGGGGPDADAQLTVYVSLPLRGPSGGDGQDAADGARLALADAGGVAGGVAVEANYLDDTEGEGAAAVWTPAQAAANARTASQDSTAIAYLGDFESGATRASLPVTNAAQVLQVSPASSAGDLVAPVPGSDEVPDAQPSGTRTFGRVIPSDRSQALAGAAWVDRMGVSRVAAESDGTAYGKAMISGFEDGLRRASLVRGAGFVYYGGLPEDQPLADARGLDGLMVTDAELVPGVSEPAGTLATSAALDPSQLPPAGQDFADAFRGEYGRPPGRYAAYGYEAMAVILDSIDRASDPTDRTDVIGAFFETAERDSVLGTYSIDNVGETTLDRMTGYELGRGEPKPVAALGGPG